MWPQSGLFLLLVQEQRDGPPPEKGCCADCCDEIKKEARPGDCRMRPADSAAIVPCWEGEEGRRPG